MRSDWIKTRQTKYAAYATTYIVIFIAVLVFVNVLADRYNKSYDATANKRFSLSDQTDKIVKGLKQDASITYYGEASRFPEARDLLDRYANLSGTHAPHRQSQMTSGSAMTYLGNSTTCLPRPNADNANH